MTNLKPTLSSTGKTDDPVSKSRGGHFFVVTGRDREAKPIFNLPPNIYFYAGDRIRNDLFFVVRNETSFHFSKRLK